MQLVIFLPTGPATLKRFSKTHRSCLAHSYFFTQVKKRTGQKPTGPATLNASLKRTVIFF
jgi:hypothetical protein